MGNQNLIQALKRANQIPLEDKNVTFFDGRFKAEYIFQRHNFQMYKVRDTTIPQQQAADYQNQKTTSYYLRIINSLNDDDSIAIIEHMQQTLIHICHPSLVQYSAIAVEQEHPHIKFVILEEDLTDNSITLRSLLDTIRLPQNKLLAMYFAEKQYIYEFILQALQALAYLNANGKTFGELHGDISPMSIVIKFTQNQQNCSFRVKILDYLKIRDLVEIAQQSQEAASGTFPLAQTMLSGRSSSPRPFGAAPGASSSEKLTKALPYDAPERQFVNQKDIGIQADVWSLGVVLYEFLVSPEGSKRAIESIALLRTLSYAERVREIRDNIRDVAMQELLTLMLRDHEMRPTAEQLVGHQILNFFSYIIQRNISLDDTSFLGQQEDPRQVIPALLSALQLSDKNKAIVSFFTLMRLIQDRGQHDPSLQDYVFTFVMRQQAYIQMLELLVICMKEYSVSQSTYLAPQGRDTFTDLYILALQILARALQSSEQHFKQSMAFDVTPTQMRRQFYLAGFLSLAMLLCEQINRIALRTSEPIAEIDASYLELTLTLLSAFTEQASPTALIAAEKAGLVNNLLKLLKVHNTKDFMTRSTKQTILQFLATTAGFMPVNVLKTIGTVTGIHHLDRLEYLSNPPLFQTSKTIYKKFVTEALAANLIKLPVASAGQQGSFEKAVTQLIYFCSIDKTMQLANAFQICTESLRLSALLATAQPSAAQKCTTKYDLGYICRTCTSLLQGLTNHVGSKILYICYVCAQLCHSKHAIEPVGYMTTANGWSNGCQCQLVQGFQVNLETQGSKDEDGADAQQQAAADVSFHTCKARYETLQDGVVRSELNQPQIVFDHKYMYQERAKLQAAVSIDRATSVRKSDQITILETPSSLKLQDEDKESAVVYTTESFDVVSICSCEPIASTTNCILLPPQQQQTTQQHTQQQQNVSLPTQTMMQHVTSPKLTEMSGNVMLSPSSSTAAPLVKNFMSRTMPTNHTPGQRQSPKNSNLKPQQKYLQPNSAANRQQQPDQSALVLTNANQFSAGSSVEEQANGLGPDKIRAYFEVKIMLGGFYDQVAIGLTNQANFPESDTFVGYVDGSIGFHADDGKCFINGDSFEYSSPYGSQSTVGCGYTSSGDVFFTRDGIQLPLIKSSAVWPDLETDSFASLLYPVVSMRGKLSTVKVHFALADDYAFRTPQINAEFDNPAVNIAMDKSLLKIIATELPKGYTHAILESLKNYVQRVQPPSSETSLIEDFYHRLLAMRQSATQGNHQSRTGSTRNNSQNVLKRQQMQGSSSHPHLLQQSASHHQQSMGNLRSMNHGHHHQSSNINLYSSTSHQSRSSTANNNNAQYQKQLQRSSVNAIGHSSAVNQNGATGHAASSVGGQPSNMSKLKIHYPAGSSSYAASKQHPQNQQQTSSTLKKSTLSPRSSNHNRLQQTSSLGYLQKYQGNNNSTAKFTKNGTADSSYLLAVQTSSRLENGGSLQRTSDKGGGDTASTSRKPRQQTAGLINKSSLRGSNHLGPSSMVSGGSKTVAKKSLSRTKRENQHQLSILSNNKQSAGTKARLASSIEHSKDRAAMMKASRSTANLMSGSTTSKVMPASASTTTLMKKATAYTQASQNMLHHSSSAKQMLQSQQHQQTASRLHQSTTLGGGGGATSLLKHSATSAHHQQSSAVNKTTASGGLQVNSRRNQNAKEGIKNQQQLILVGSGQAKPIKQSVVVQPPASGLSKQDSSESVEKQSNSLIELKSNQTNYNSANPSFFYGNIGGNSSLPHHSQSVQNLKTFVASDSSSLVHAAGGGGNNDPSMGANTASKNNGPKQSVKLTSKNNINNGFLGGAGQELGKNPQTQSLSNLLLNGGDSAIQRGYYSHQSHLRNTASSPTTIYKHAETPQGAPQTSTILSGGGGKKQPQSAMPNRVFSPHGGHESGSPNLNHDMMVSRGQQLHQHHQTEDYANQPLTIPSTMAVHPTMNNAAGHHKVEDVVNDDYGMEQYLARSHQDQQEDADNLIQMQSNDNVADSASNNDQEQQQQQMQFVSAFSTNQPSSGAAASSTNIHHAPQNLKAAGGAFYKAYTNSAQTMPRYGNTAANHAASQQNLLLSNNNRKATSSGRVQSNQVHKPIQNVSTSISVGAGGTLGGEYNFQGAAANANSIGSQNQILASSAPSTKAQHLKQSYVKVPKPRLTSAMSAKNASIGPTAKNNQHANKTRSTAQVNQFSAQNRPLANLINQNSAQNNQAVDQKSRKNEDLLPAKDHHAIFYPQLASNIDISIPGSEVTDQSMNATAKRKSALNTHQFKGDAQQDEQKNCSIF